MYLVAALANVTTRTSPSAASDIHGIVYGLLGNRSDGLIPEYSSENALETTFTP
jgi:hypothetical protein